jgi:shikimate dehydrogenase
MTTKFCVVGSPIDHSLSPVIHRAAYSLLGLDFSYEKLDVTIGKLKAVLEDKSLAGVSVTMPLKYEAYNLADTCTLEATKTGVVNSLVRSSVGWVGHNTDVIGFGKSFQPVPAARTITILGCGATARSAALAISRAFPWAEVFVVGRNALSVREFIEQINAFGIKASVLPPEPSSVLSADLVISTVPGSAFGELWGKLGSDTTANRGFLFDVAYDPWPSPASQAWGDNSISGLELLIWQAIEQVKLFAESKGYAVEVDDQELYFSMKAAVTEQSGLK